MAEIKDKVVTVESLSALHEHNKDTYMTKSDVVSVANGGTGATTAEDALVNLGITATTDELKYMEGVTSNVQTQLDAKQETITGAATTIVSSDLDADRALISNSSGKVVVSDITSDEINCLDGVVSNIQTQLDNKSESGHTHDYLPLSGGKITNTLTLNGLILSSGKDYGNELPSAGTIGRVFLKKRVTT